MPALERIWADSMGKSMADFNFRTVTTKFNELVYQYPIRVPERYALVIRWGAGRGAPACSIAGLAPWERVESGTAQRRKVMASVHAIMHYSSSS